MAVLQRSGARLTRRRLLTSLAACASVPLAGIARPALSFAASRPQLSHGVQSGDVSGDSGVVWARADRPSRMLVEASTTESFADIVTGVEIDLLPESDCTGKVLLDELPSGQDIFYRIRMQDLASPTHIGEPVVGRFRTAPADRRSISFVWSGDTCGQGWGIDESRGGMRTYATMRRNAPDFFIHCGDVIYSDCTVPARQALPNGEVWRNIVTAEKAKVAETLADYRGNYKYNLLDANLRAFNAEVPMFVQWDDHEVRDDWGQTDASNGIEPGLLLRAARGRRAFHEYMPLRESLAEPGRVYRRIGYGPLLDVFMLDMRSYRGPAADAGEAAPTPIFGARQLAWLKRELGRSRATWKVIAADLPIGLISADAIARGDGPPRGREHEVADLLSFIKHARIANTLWITADVHYTAAHHYDPNRAVFQDFVPFWEFVSGPIHAGTWDAGTLDNTFGPKVVFEKACAKGAGNLAPCFGLQFFGHVAIDGTTEVMTVTLKDVGDNALWATRIEPKPAARPLVSGLTRV